MTYNMCMHMYAVPQPCSTYRVRVPASCETYARPEAQGSLPLRTSLAYHRTCRPLHHRWRHEDGTPNIDELMHGVLRAAAVPVDVEASDVDGVRGGVRQTVQMTLGDYAAWWTRQAHAVCMTCACCVHAVCMCTSVCVTRHACRSCGGVRQPLRRRPTRMPLQPLQVQVQPHAPLSRLKPRR